MTETRLLPAMLASITMCAFAANSILCKLAFVDGHIDPASFTTIRLVSGAITLLLIVIGIRLFSPKQRKSQPLNFRGRYWGALCLFSYAACFSYAYVELQAGTGALILFGAGQITLLLANIVMGYRLNAKEWSGFAMAFGGLCILFLPGATAPSYSGAAFMVLSGASWAFYTLTGKKSTSPVLNTAENFIKTIPLALILIGFHYLYGGSGGHPIQATAEGITYAIASGAVASGLGYSLWYLTLRHISLIEGAVVQLSVPTITAIAGLLLLDENLTLRLIAASAITLSGIAIVILSQRRTA